MPQRGYGTNTVQSAVLRMASEQDSPEGALACTKSVSNTELDVEKSPAWPTPALRLGIFQAGASIYAAPNVPVRGGLG